LNVLRITQLFLVTNLLSVELSDTMQKQAID